MTNKNTNQTGGSRQLTRKFGVWIIASLLLIILPMIFDSGFAVTMMSEMGIAIIFALSYNMLLGQGGMLSFGHAVFYGFGGFLAIHAVNLVSDGVIVMPLELIPLVGGLAGLFFGIVFGYISTKKAGTTFALISLGIVELVVACVLLFPSFFGGEEGVSCDRMLDYSITGVGFGKGIEVFYLIAFWVIVSAGLMYLQTQTPLGRIANAVRDNPERAPFIGYNIHLVRFFQFALSGFFAGIAGGLLAINYEIVNSEMIGAIASGNILLMTYIGGIGHFFGPILGAVVFTFLHLTLVNITLAGQLYLGVLFIAIILWAPNGMAGIIMAHEPVWKAGLIRRLLPQYLAALGAGLLMFFGALILVEVNYHLNLSIEPSNPMRLFGVEFLANSWPPWLLSIGMMVAGFFMLRPIIGKIALKWDELTQVMQKGELA
ncbi:MAG: branched-chain amino acid ABC transporter permease [Proteobacteria bacterium]|nr:branched-chain amino acid ABC transporter permease [Pseudomonadota bacterium]